MEGLDKKTVVESSRSVGESNPSGLDARQGGISRYSAAGESKAVHPQSLVLVERHALEAVRQSQAELTRYVRAYFNSQERITACAELYESLLEGKKQPETWRSSDYLRRIEGSLRRIRPYARFLSGQGLEDEFSEQSNVFDSALADLMDIVAGDMSTVPQKVIKAAPAKAKAAPKAKAVKKAKPAPKKAAKKAAKMAKKPAKKASKPAARKPAKKAGSKVKGKK